MPNLPEELFQKYDINNDEFVSRHAFFNVFDGINQYLKLSEEQKIVVMNVVDNNRTGKVNYREFLNLISSLKKLKSKK